MSRIEKALERAAALRGGKETEPAPSPIEKALEKASEFRSRPDCPPHSEGETGKAVSPPVDLEIEHPLIVTYKDPHSPIAEEFRKLKSTLVSLVRSGQMRRTIMVTSSLSGEGKSVTAVNLAITLAQEYDHTVLLIDGDLRKPAVHKYLNLAPGLGLADCLREGTPVSSALIKTGIGKLSCLPAGRSVENPAELIGAQKMKFLLQEAKQRYPERFIIIDAPPVLPVAETRTLGNMVDGILFVIKEGAVSLTNIQDALDAIPREKVLGVVYNNIRSETLNGRYHYYYHGY